MKKFILITLLLFLGCSNVDEKMIEKCADQKIISIRNYMNGHQYEWVAEKNSFYRNEKKRIYKNIFSKDPKGTSEETFIEIREYYFNLKSTHHYFKNLMRYYTYRTEVIKNEYVKMSLIKKRKFPKYVSSLRLCEEEKKKNPLTFKLQYEETFWQNFKK